MFKLRTGCHAVLITMLFAAAARSTTVPAGSILELRLRTAVGSRVSHPGDTVRASVVAPVFNGEGRIILKGATLFGVVAESIPIGLGVKHDTAVLSLRFHSIRLANGSAVAAEARVVSVETARERVDEEGRVIGIDPAANLSSAVSFFISTGLLAAGHIPPVVLFKLLAIRSPDPEIFFPQGTELLVRLTQDVPLDAGGPGDDVTPLSKADLARVRGALSGLQVQQAEMKHGRAADPVNIALTGTPRQVESAFRAAGWSGESPHSAVSLYRLYHCLVQRMGYTTAPMSRLTLNGVLPTNSFQKSLDTITRRHHVRLWRQGSTDVWLGAATEDIGLTVTAMHVSHVVDDRVDNERAKVVDDLWFAGCVGGASVMGRPAFFPKLHNGTNIDTDGRLAVLRLRDCQGSAIAEKQADAHVSCLRVAWQAMVRDTLRANPLTVSLEVVRNLPRWTSFAARRSVPMQAFRRPSIVN